MSIFKKSTHQIKKTDESVKIINILLKKKVKEEENQ